jgi:hypothetical protein
MKNSHKKAKRSNFLLAAEMVFLGHTVYDFAEIEVNGRTLQCQLWCCINLESVAGTYYSSDMDLFKECFDPGVRAVSGGWWQRRECEARVLALLLCAEMLRR